MSSWKVKDETHGTILRIFAFYSFFAIPILSWVVYFQWTVDGPDFCFYITKEI